MTKDYATSLKRTSILLAALLFMAVLTVVNLSSIFSSKAGAAQLTSRKVTLTSSLQGNVGAATPADSETNGADVSYAFEFTHPSAATVQGIQLEFCTTAIGSCTGPTGLDVLGSAITLQEDDTVAFGQTFTVASDAVDNVLQLSNSTGQAVGAGSVIELTVNSITNPTTLGAFFARVTTYSDDDFQLVDLVDEGTVASATTNGIFITSRVAETLGFSTGAVTDDATTTGVIDPGSSCDAINSSGALNLGDPTETTLSIANAYDNYSAFRIYTNAASGVVVNYEGSTLTKGGDTITAIGGSPLASDVANEQFGLGVDLANGGDDALAVSSIPGLGTLDLTYADLAAGLNGDAGEIEIETDYIDGAGTITDGGDASFLFVPDTSTQIAHSDGYVVCNTAAVRYIANIHPTTEAGTYTTTVVYSAVPTY